MTIWTLRSSFKQQCCCKLETQASKASTPMQRESVCVWEGGGGGGGKYGVHGAGFEQVTLTVKPLESL